MRIKSILKLARSQEAKPLVRANVFVLENPLVNYLLHLRRPHGLEVVVKALRLESSNKPLYERLVLRSVRPASVLSYPDAVACQPLLRLAPVLVHDGDLRSKTLPNLHERRFPAARAARRGDMHRHPPRVLVYPAQCVQPLSGQVYVLHVELYDFVWSRRPQPVRLSPPHPRLCGCSGAPPVRLYVRPVVHAVPLDYPPYRGRAWNAPLRRSPHEDRMDFFRRPGRVVPPHLAAFPTNSMLYAGCRLLFGLLLLSSSARTPPLPYLALHLLRYDL